MNSIVTSPSHLHVAEIVLFLSILENLFWKQKNFSAAITFPGDLKRLSLRGFKSPHSRNGEILMPVVLKDFSTACSYIPWSICQVGNGLDYNHQFFTTGLVFKIMVVVIFIYLWVENFIIFPGFIISVFKLLLISYLNSTTHL